MKKYLTILFILVGFSAFSQKIYKEIQGSYENPIVGDVTIEGYELTYKGYTYIYQTETDHSAGDNYVSYNYPGEEGAISVRINYNGTKYLVFGDGEYILIPKEKEKKEKVSGDPNASGYYGSGGNYGLGNRTALNKAVPDYPCNEEGRVVVTISVDQSGRVITAHAGMSGTTNSAPCLLNEAKAAALKTTFNADVNAPSKQVGEIIYNFSLSE